jgi:hypothetical protein
LICLTIQSMQLDTDYTINFQDLITESMQLNNN